MGDSPGGARTQLLTQIIGGGVLLMMGYLVSASSDRYHATDAKRDLAAIKEEIRVSEIRMKELLTSHAVGGPHDDVRERIIVLETWLRALKEETGD